MQSFLQYRRIGQSVRDQLGRDSEKAHALVGRHIRASENISRPSTELAGLARITTRQDDEGNAIDDEDSYRREADLNKLETTRTRYSERTALGYSLTGVDARARATNESEAGYVFVVGWEGEEDPLSPKNWPWGRRIMATVVVSFIAVAGTAASSIDAAVLPQYSAYWGVSEVAGTLATALYLVGFAIGSQFAGEHWRV